MKRTQTNLAAAVACLSSFILHPSSFAQTTQPTVSASLGFAGVFKPDAWMPVYVRITDEQPRPATLELRTTRGRAGHVVDARIHTSPQATTFTLYAPPVGVLDHITLQLRDANGGLIRELDLSDAAAATPAALGGPSFGVAGPAGAAQRVVNQLVNDTQENVAAGAISPTLLPDRPIGYEAIDVLVLPELNTDTLDDEVESAIARWVRAGGVVIAWPGAQAPTVDSPLRTLLPATIGDYAERSVAGQSLATRTLTTFADAKDVRELSDGDRSIFQRRVGLGQVVLCAVDPSTLLANHPPQERIELWRRLTSNQFHLLASERRNGLFDPLVAQARGEQRLVAASPSMPIRPWLIAGLLVCLAMGPGELVLLAAARRHPRTPFTVLGLIGTLGFAVALLVVRPADATTPQRVEVAVQTDEGVCAIAAIGDQIDATQDQAVWLAGDRLDPNHQTAGELAMGQRDADAFAIDAGSLIKLAGGAPATLRSLTFPLDPHPAEPPTGDGIVDVPAVSTAAATTGRRKTGIEQLAEQDEWAPVLMDRGLAVRLVQLQESEQAAIRVSRSSIRNGTRYVVHVSRK